MADTISIQSILAQEEKQLQLSKKVKIDITEPDFKINEQVKIDLDLTMLDNQQILANFHVPINIIIYCVRCLAEIEHKLTLDFQRIYSSNPKPNQGTELIRRGQIDITEPLKEEILLSLPIKPLCEANCKGICPSCGQNLNEKQCDCSKTSSRLTRIHKQIKNKE